MVTHAHANGKRPPPRPDYTFEPGKITASAALGELAAISGRWVCWRYEWRGGRWTKPPCRISGRNAKSDDPTTWDDFEPCVKAALANGKLEGTGFVLADDGIVAGDIDDIVDEFGEITDPEVDDLIARFDTYTEVSPSGRGLRFLFKGKLPTLPNGARGFTARVGEAEVEVYAAIRYVTLTGNIYRGAPDAIADAQPMLDWLLEQNLRSGPTSKGKDGPAPDDSTLRRQLDDLLARDHRAAGLWHETAQPSGPDKSRSAAMLGIAGILARRLKWTRTQLTWALEKWCEKHGHHDKLGREIERAVEKALGDLAQEPPPDPVPDVHRTIAFDDVELMTGEISEPVFIVPDLIPEGATILAGRPKMGKTSWATNLADAVARGGLALGSIKCQQADVLYLALEDNRRRLQRRRRMMLDAERLPPVKALRFELAWPRLDENGIEKLDEACSSNKNLKLIVIDTWKKITPRRRRDQDDYSHEADAAAMIQRLAAKHQIAIIIIHHTRKGIGSEDFVDDVLGSTGLTGSADTIIGFRRKRGTSDAEISVTGRDIEETERALAGDYTTGLWKLLDGTAAEHRLSRQRKAIIELLRKHGGLMRVTDIAAQLGENYDAVRMACSRMHVAGQLVQVSGQYGLP